jgi:hypothetical protein
MTPRPAPRLASGSSFSPSLLPRLLRTYGWVPSRRRRSDTGRPAGSARPWGRPRWLIPHRILGPTNSRPPQGVSGETSGHANRKRNPSRSVQNDKLGSSVGRLSSIVFRARCRARWMAAAEESGSRAVFRRGPTHLVVQQQSGALPRWQLRGGTRGGLRSRRW